MEHTTTKTTENTKIGSKIDKSTIETIDPILYEAGIKNGLNIKDIRFCGDIIKGKTQKEAYKQVAKPTTTDKSLEQQASRKSSNIKIKDTIKEVMTNNGLDDKTLIKKHTELLNKKEVITRNNVTTGLIETIPTGEIDVSAVKAGLDMAYKLKGHYDNKDTDNPKGKINTYIDKVAILLTDPNIKNG